MAVTVEYGMSRSPARMEFARYVSVGITCRSDALGRAVRRFGGRVAQNRAAAFDGNGAERVERAHAQAEIVDRGRLAQPPLHGGRIEACNENRVGTSALLEQRLHPGERHEDGANRSLARAERKLTEIFACEHLTDREPQRCGRRLPSSRAATRSESPTSSRREGSPTGLRRLRALRQVLRSTAPRFPQAPSPTRGRETARTDRRRIHLHARCPAAALLRSDEPFGHDERNRLVERARQLLRGRIPATTRRDRPCPAAAGRGREGWRGPTRRPSAHRRAPLRQWRRRAMTARFVRQ